MRCCAAFSTVRPTPARTSPTPSSRACTRGVGAGSPCVPGIPLRGQVTAIRRRSQRGLRLEPDTTLLEGDVVVLIGDAAAVTAGEDVLLRGR